MFYYIIYLLLLIIIILFLYIKIKFKFWSKQPVFNIYNIYYWLSEPKIINYHVNKDSKYLDFQHIKCKYYNALTKKEKNKFIIFLNKHYLNNKDTHYHPEEKHIDPYFYHTSDSILSCYRLKYTKSLVATITGRQLLVELNNTEFTCYYVDYLCIHEDYRKKGYAEKMIQTHEYYQRTNSNVLVSLFKKETNLHLIVPLVLYKVYKFNINIWNHPVYISTSHRIIKLTKKNIYNYWDIIYKNLNFNKILCNIATLIELIETNNIIIYVLYDIISKENIGMYIFKDCVTKYNNLHIIENIGSICLSNNKDLFIDGFFFLITLIKHKYHYLFIENLTDNNILLDAINIKYTMIGLSTYAYYFYNYSSKPINSNKLLIIF